MTATLALWRLGLDWSDVAQMTVDLLAAIEQANQELLEDL